MTRSQHSAALGVALLLSTALQGCALFISPTTREDWSCRLSAAEANLANRRAAISNMNNVSEINQLAFVDEIQSASGGWPDTDVFDTKTAIRVRASDTRELLNDLDGIKEDLAMLRDEVEGVGW